jgi:hypothetical protein
MLGVQIIEFCWLLNLRKREAYYSNPNTIVTTMLQCSRLILCLLSPFNVANGLSTSSLPKHRTNSPFNLLCVAAATIKNRSRQQKKILRA